jgi:hypothetical protein
MKKQEERGRQSEDWCLLWANRDSGPVTPWAVFLFPWLWNYFVQIAKCNEYAFYLLNRSKCNLNYMYVF